MDKELIRKGQKLRRRVLGDAYVDAASKNVNEFNRPFQELIAEYVWGNLWSRKGLTHRERALINLAMLTAVGRTEEIKIYLRAAPNVGVTRDDIREVFMQTAVYCGIPAALDSFRLAQKFFEDEDGKGGQDAKGAKGGRGRKKAGRK